MCISLFSDALQIGGFRAGELQQEIRRKLVTVAADGLVENAGLDAIELGQIGIEDHAFAADRMDDVLDGRKSAGRFAGWRRRSLAETGGRHGDERPVAETMRKSVSA